MKQNLEALIEEHAKVMAKQMVEAANEAGSEEDIRHEVNKLIDEFITKAGLKIKGRHEYGLAGGRIDSKYGGVVIEYKDPKGAGKIIEDKNAPGVKAVVKQIKKRFKDLDERENVGYERIIGVGCDGDTFVFIRQKGGKLDVEEPLPVTKYTVQRLLRALVSLGAEGLSFKPDNLTGHFGADSKTAEDGIRLIHDVINETENPKAQAFFRQWQILFGEVCGYDIHGQSAKVKKLADHYDVLNPNPAELLFAVHTYYAIFMKMLATEIVASFSPLGTSTLKKLFSAPTSAKLRDELRNLEQGGIWKQLGIRNFLEGDLFSWYLDAWDERFAKAIRVMMQDLDQFDPTTLSVDPTESRDLLKQLYQHLFPKSVRHDLGEYYTPDWLAELVLDELGYDGNPDKRLLDPACGSGTFLVMALNRVKTWYDEHRYECGFGEDELLRKILRNIIGFDLNPLAVMAARTNYLMAIRDLLRHGGDIELPVYLCDSIMTPKDYSTSAASFSYLRLSTAVGPFNIPRDILKDSTTFARYAETIESCVRNTYSPEEFLQRCHDEGIPTTETELHKALYKRLSELNENNQNGVWARIIKNAFAPLFIGKVDFVAGNPPWVNWESLPEEYRDGMKPLWQEYGLFTLSGSAGRLGGGKKDLSMLFVYTAVDNYLSEGARLGFVITQSVFKTPGAGDGFRQMRFKKGNSFSYLKPISVLDLSAIQVFEGATNRTAVFICEKQNRSFKYPVKYVMWNGPSRIRQDVSLNEVLAVVRRVKMNAIPIDTSKNTSPWLTAPQYAIIGIQKVIGQSDYLAYEGLNTGGLNGAYWLEIIEPQGKRKILIRNLHDRGKIKVKQIEAVVESRLIYPQLFGTDVQKWKVIPSGSVLLLQDPCTRQGISELEMKQKYPLAYSYIKNFETELRQRAAYRKYFKENAPFYSMFDFGKYSLSDIKVVWQGMGSSMRCGVCVPFNGKPVMTNQAMHPFIPVDTEDEAYYIAAVMNSSPFDYTIRCHTVLGGKSFAQGGIFRTMHVPIYHNKNNIHNELSQLSRQCHSAASKDNTDAVTALEAEIDEVSANIWGITDAELKAIRNALNKE